MLMKKKAYLSLALLFLLGLGLVVTLRLYSLEMVNVIVMNALTQKAPDDYPKTRIQERFARCLAKAREQHTEHSYLQKLLQISHRIEKIQYLEDKELNDLLNNLPCE